MTDPKCCRVEKVSAAKACENLPEKEQWDIASLGDVDLLILAAGFEDRALALPSDIQSAGLEVGCVFVGRYETNSEDNDKKYSVLKPIIESISPEIKEANADAPDEILAAIKSLVSGWSEGRRVVFDISSASSPFICTVIGAVCDLAPEVSFTIVYSEAESYAEPTDLNSSPDEWTDEDVAEAGISLVDVNPIFRGAHKDNSQSYVVAFPGMSKQRMACCLSHFSEEFERFARFNVKWVVPVTDHEKHLWRRDKIAESIVGLMGESCGHDLAVERFKELPNENRVECDIQDYASATKTLLEAASQNLGKNLGVIMLGSKLHTVGAALALCVTSEITSVYARPKEFFAEGYSSGVGKKWMIIFRSLSSTLAELRSCGSLVLRLEEG